MKKGKNLFEVKLSLRGSSSSFSSCALALEPCAFSSLPLLMMQMYSAHSLLHNHLFHSFIMPNLAKLS
jgi:hypothetical protein